MKGRSVPVAWVVGFLLLAATIGVPAWYLNRPVPPVGNVSLTDELDTVATGRVDAPGGVCSLDPPLPGGIVRAVHVKEDGQGSERPISHDRDHRRPLLCRGGEGCDLGPRRYGESGVGSDPRKEGQPLSRGGEAASRKELEAALRRSWAGRRRSSSEMRKQQGTQPDAAPLTEGGHPADGRSGQLQRRASQS